MDYIDQLKQFAKRAEKLISVIETEEATKNSLILPFFQMLGYDVFNPLEVVPEFTADVGVKKGEKVDYCILKDGQPAILIEAKSCKEILEKHDSQLFRYFGTTSAKLAILTNGVQYRFYTDLDAPNKMDLVPFLEINLFALKENVIGELKRFQKSELDPETIFDAAADLRDSKLIKEYLKQQSVDPEKAFLYPIIKAAYDGVQTPKVVERFKDLYIKSFAQYINDLLNERFQAAIASDKALNEEKRSEVAPSEEPIKEQEVVTTPEELEGFAIVKSLVHDIIDPTRVTYKDTLSYISITIDDKVTKWICRLRLDGNNHYLYLPSSDKKRNAINIDSVNDLYKYTAEIRQSAKDLI